MLKCTIILRVKQVLQDKCNNSKDMKRRQRSGLHNGGYWFSLLPTQFTKTWISRKNNKHHDKQKNKVKLWAMKTIYFWTMRSEKKAGRKENLGRGRTQECHKRKYCEEGLISKCPIKLGLKIQTSTQRVNIYCLFLFLFLLRGKRDHENAVMCPSIQQQSAGAISLFMIKSSS